MQALSPTRSLRLLGLVLTAAAACRSSDARRFEAESAALGRHIDALRDAPNSGKLPLLTALEGAPCERPELCELKALCVNAYRLHLDGLGAKDRVKALLAVPDGGADATLAAASELARAERDLELASGATERCVTRQGEIRRRSRER